LALLRGYCRKALERGKLEAVKPEPEQEEPMDKLFNEALARRRTP
jgi:hypothetical protein